eukprot:9487690-Pyramimonas_sp.AAC.1
MCTYAVSRGYPISRVLSPFDVAALLHAADPPKECELRRSWKVSNADEGLLRGALGPLGYFGGLLGASSSLLGTSWGPPGTSWGSLGSSWGSLSGKARFGIFFVALLGRSWGRLGALLGCLGGLLGRRGALLGRLGGCLGGLLGRLGAILRASWAVLE